MHVKIRKQHQIDFSLISRTIICIFKENIQDNFMMYFDLREISITIAFVS